MAILYKYCDQVGVIKILEAVELKLPYVSEVNDPLECSAVFVCKKGLLQNTLIGVILRPKAEESRRSLDSSLRSE